MVSEVKIVVKRILAVEKKERERVSEKLLMFSFETRARGETSSYCLAEILESLERTVSIRFLQHAVLSNTTASAHERKR